MSETTVSLPFSTYGDKSLNSTNKPDGDFLLGINWAKIKKNPSNNGHEFSQLTL